MKRQNLMTNIVVNVKTIKYIVLRQLDENNSKNNMA